MPRLLRCFQKEHKAEVYTVAFSPDGKTFASASLDTTVMIWTAPAGEVVATLTGHYKGVIGLAFFPYGRKLATSDFDTIRIWDMATMKAEATIPAHKSWAYWIAVAPDGATLLSTGNDFYVRLWDTVSHEKVFQWRGPRDAAEGLAISPDGTKWAIAMGSSITVWDATSREKLFLLEGHRQRVKSVAFSRDGETLASASYDKSIKLWDVMTKTERHTLKGHTNRAWCVVFRPGGRQRPCWVRVWQQDPSLGEYHSVIPRILSRSR